MDELKQGLHKGYLGQLPTQKVFLKKASHQQYPFSRGASIAPNTLYEGPVLIHP